VQNGVLPARAKAFAPKFTELAQAGVEILANDFLLRQRGIPPYHVRTSPFRSEGGKVRNRRRERRQAGGGSSRVSDDHTFSAIFRIGVASIG